MTLRGVLVCHRANQTGPISAEWTYWRSVKEARQAEAELTPCGEHCIGVHAVVLVDVGAPPRARRSHVLRSPSPTKSPQRTTPSTQGPTR